MCDLLLLLLSDAASDVHGDFRDDDDYILRNILRGCLRPGIQVCSQDVQAADVGELGTGYFSPQKLHWSF